MKLSAVNLLCEWTPFLPTFLLLLPIIWSWTWSITRPNVSLMNGWMNVITICQLVFWTCVLFLRREMRAWECLQLKVHQKQQQCSGEWTDCDLKMSDSSFCPFFIYLHFRGKFPLLVNMTNILVEKFPSVHSDIMHLMQHNAINASLHR